MEQLKPGSGNVEVRNQGWEECHTKVDRIISIGALEHIGKKNYTPFFARCRELLPDDGRMLLHCIVRYDLPSLEAKGIGLSHDNILFAKFIAKEIFPGGQLSDPGVIIEYIKKAGFEVEKTQAIGLHYARTCRIWADNLEQRREEAIELKSEEVYDRYMRYLIGCDEHFTSGHIDLFQFTMRVS